MGLPLGGLVSDLWDQCSRDFFRVIGRSSREDINIVREEVLVSKQRLLPVVGEENLRNDQPYEGNGLPQNPSQEVARHYLALQNGSQELDVKLRENSPEAATLDRENVTRKVSFFRQFIYKHIFHKYILLPTMLLIIGMGVNNLGKDSCASLMGVKDWMINTSKGLISSPQTYQGFPSFQLVDHMQTD